MTEAKVTIEVDSNFLERIDLVAGESGMSRSQLIAQAAEEFLRHRETRSLLARLDEAYAEGPSAEEAELQRRMRVRHGSQLEGPW